MSEKSMSQPDDVASTDEEELIKEEELHLPEHPLERARLCEPLVHELCREYGCKLESRIRVKPVGTESDAEVLFSSRPVVVGYPWEEDGTS